MSQFSKVAFTEALRQKLLHQGNSAAVAELDAGRAKRVRDQRNAGVYAPSAPAAPPPSFTVALRDNLIRQGNRPAVAEMDAGDIQRRRYGMAAGVPQPPTTEGGRSEYYTPPSPTLLGTNPEVRRIEQAKSIGESGRLPPELSFDSAGSMWNNPNTPSAGDSNGMYGRLALAPGTPIVPQATPPSAPAPSPAPAVGMGDRAALDRGMAQKAPVNFNDRRASQLDQIMSLRRQMESAPYEQRGAIRAQIQTLADDRLGLLREQQLGEKAARLGTSQLPMAPGGGVDQSALAAILEMQKRRSDASMEQNYRGALEGETDPQVRANALDQIARFAGRQGKMDPTGTEADFFAPGRADYASEGRTAVPGAIQRDERRRQLGMDASDEAERLASERERREANRKAIEQAAFEAQKRQLERVGEEDPASMIARTDAQRYVDANKPGTFNKEQAKVQMETENAALASSGVDDSLVKQAQNSLKIISGQMSDIRSGVVSGPFLGKGNEEWSTAILSLDHATKNLEAAHAKVPGSAKQAALQLLLQFPPANGGVYKGGGIHSGDSEVKARELTQIRQRLQKLTG